MFNSLVIGHSFAYHLEHRLASKHTTWRDPENSEGKVCSILWFKGCHYFKVGSRYVKLPP